MPPVDDGPAADDDPLERTDRMPMLAGMEVDPDVADDAVPMEAPPVGTRSVFTRPAGANLAAGGEPKRLERSRLHGDRGLRPSADTLALKRSYDELRDVQAAATARAAALATELSAAKAQLEAERARVGDLDRALTEQALLAEATRSVLDDTRRETLQRDGEMRTLRDAVEERTRHAAQVDAALQAAQTQVTALTAELDRSRQSAQTQVTALTAALDASRQSAADLATRSKAIGADNQAVMRELQDAKAQAAAYLEQLRTREWRRGFDENVLRDFDSKIHALQADRNALRTERDQFAAKVQDQEQAAVEAAGKLAALDAERQRLLAELTTRNAALAAKDAASEAALAAKEAALEAALATLAAKEAALATIKSAADEAARREGDDLAAANTERASLAAQVEAGKLELQRRDQEMEVLLAHLDEARRPLAPFEAQMKRLTDEMAAQTHTLQQLTDENRALHVALERARGVLDEREFLIRRLERSDSNLPPTRLPLEGADLPQWAPISAELIRVDGAHSSVHPLVRRTRIGRAPGCELQVDSSSVSRHHALVLMSSREVIIEDLHSTNGVLINGRKITRQLLKDGDLLMIGEAQFRLSIKSGLRAGTAPGEADAAAAQSAAPGVPGASAALAPGTPQASVGAAAPGPTAAPAPEPVPGEPAAGPEAAGGEGSE